MIDFESVLKVLFDLDQTITKPFFTGIRYPWEILSRIRYLIGEISSNLPGCFNRIDENIWVGEGTTIDTSAKIKGPAIIGLGCEIRHAAYIRENVIIGNRVVAGNSTEIKNSILFNNVQVPHFNYVGDSVMGYRSHLGAGAILSNVKSTGETIRVKTGGGYIETGLRKFGAIIGDFAEIGCNSVLNPGTIVGRGSMIYPLTSVRGVIPPNHILKSNGDLVVKRNPT